MFLSSFRGPVAAVAEGDVRMVLGLGLLVGILLGLTGAGGAALAVPLLMWSLGWTLPQAAPAALLAACFAAALGTAMSWRTSHVRYRAAALMAIAGFAAAPAGHSLAFALPAAALNGVFAAVLTLGAVRMWLQARAWAGDGPRETRAPAPDTSVPMFCTLDRTTGRIVWTPRCAAGVAGVGAGAGFLAGMLGVGGGVVIVPSLRAFSEIPLKSTIATSLMAVALISGASAGVYLLQGGMPPWNLVAPFIAGACAGTLGGRLVAHRIPAVALQRLFAVFLLAVAAIMALDA